jgi:hypothetical protein
MWCSSSQFVLASDMPGDSQPGQLVVREMAYLKKAKLAGGEQRQKWNRTL